MDMDEAEEGDATGDGEAEREAANEAAVLELAQYVIANHLSAIQEAYADRADACIMCPGTCRSRAIRTTEG